MACGQHKLVMLAVLCCLAAAHVVMSSSFNAVDPSIFRTYFKCPPCDPSRCVLPQGCGEMVMEPGVCGCCLTCALQEGEPCGILTSPCGRGLQCRPPFDDNGEAALETLFRGKAICMRTRGSTRGMSARGEGNGLWDNREQRRW